MSRRQNICSGLICCLLLVMAATQATAVSVWETRLVVRAGSGENRLSFGQRPDATLGVDGQYEVPALLGGNVKAWFDLEGGAYWRDIKGFQADQETTWTLQVESNQAAGLVQLSWPNATLPGGSLVLMDLTSGAQIDMKQQSSYTYNNAGPRQFQLVVGP